MQIRRWREAVVMQVGMSNELPAAASFTQRNTTQQPPRVGAWNYDCHKNDSSRINSSGDVSAVAAACGDASTAASVSLTSVVLSAHWLALIDSLHAMHCYTMHLYV